MQEAIYLSHMVLRDPKSVLLETYPQATNYPGMYLVREMLEGQQETIRFLTRTQLEDLYLWRQSEPADGYWGDVVSRQGMVSHTHMRIDDMLVAPITVLQVTYQGNEHVTMQFEVPDDCPESVKFGGVSLILMTRLLKAFGPMREQLTQGHSWLWELGPRT